MRSDGRRAGGQLGRRAGGQAGGRADDNRYRPTILPSFLWLLLACNPATALAGQIPDEVKHNIAARIESGSSVGIVVGIVNVAGQEFFSHGMRTLRTARPVDENSIYEIGSITKVFTGILLADMVVRGELTLEAPVRDFLPERVTVPSWDGEQITLLDLTTHTSALPRLPDNMSPGDPANPYADYTVRQLYRFLSRHSLRRAIGAEYEYSNVAVGLLGHALARSAGMSYEDLVVSRIAEELGMESTRIALTRPMRARLARGHSDGVQVGNWDIPTLAGAGALRSTGADMLRFISANLGFVPTRLSNAMQMSHRARPNVVGPVGLGWHIIERDGSHIVWHNGSTGGYRTFAGFDPEKRLGVVVLSNSRQSVDDIGLHILDPRNELIAVGGAVGVDARVPDDTAAR